MAKNKQYINSQAKLYIQAVFEKRLREEGFVCPDDKLLCWYRVVNHEIVNSIIFYTAWSDLPLMLSIGCGIFPLFVEPIFTKSVLFAKRPINDIERFRNTPIVENYPINTMAYCRFSDDVAVDAPLHDGRGIYTFDSLILPEMDSITTVDAAFMHHKQKRAERNTHSTNQLGIISNTFADMALYLGAEEVYPECQAGADTAIYLYEDLSTKRPLNPDQTRDLQHWYKIRSAFDHGGRNSYLRTLENQKEVNIHHLKKKFGLSI